ncbi:MAG: hypothetical protein HGGPFJEG_01193 [Ignavibacteria bacterium]|nr:hypothetical protein [Ignavibacteria bacterium]
MKSIVSIVLFLFLLLTCPEIKTQSIYFPPLSGNQWESVTPSSLGWCTEKIDSLLNYLESKNTKAFLVLKNGRIVIEHYFGTFSADSIWYWASAGKTLTAMLCGIAQQEGYINISDSSSKYLGAGWTSCQPGKEKLITIRNQLTMTTGLNDNVVDPFCTLPSCLIYLTDAGSRWAYHNAPYTLLDKVIENSTGQTYNLYFNSRIKNRIGMNGIWLPSGFNNIYYSNARSVARFGILILNKGVWNVDTLLHDTSYFNSMTNTSQNLNLSYGYLWWLNGKSSYMLPGTQFVFPGSWAPDAPDNMIAALGKSGQILNMVPGSGIVLVRLGNAPDTSFEITTHFNNQIWIRLNDIICDPSSVKNLSSVSPQQFILHQNYPNPFNPETTFDYYIGKNGFVSLKIFNILGKEVQSIINEYKNTGSYSVKWNASEFPGGAYLYRFSFDEIYKTGKLILIK